MFLTPFISTKYIQIANVLISVLMVYICFFSSSEVTAKYFEMLNDDDIKKLYQVYQDDFKLFNYTFTYGKLKFP